MLRPCVRITVALWLLLPQAADSADLGNKSRGEATYFTAQGDSLFRQSRFEDAESAYSDALRLDPGNVRGHLGVGKIAAMLSDRRRATKHYSAAYQSEPLNPDAILAFASVVIEPDARRTLLRNFLALSPANDERKQDVRARLRIEEQLGMRKTGVLASAYQPYRIQLSSLRAGGLFLDARINGVRDLRLILDTGATGVTLNATAGRNAGLEFLAPAMLTGFGSGDATPARVALASSFETGSFKISNQIIEVSETDLTSDADGMVGLDVFQDFLIRLDPGARRLELSRLDPQEASASCKDCMQAYRVGHLLLVRGQVSGHGEGYFILDTGSPYTMISRNLVPQSGSTAMMTGAQGRQHVAVPMDLVTLRLGSRHLWGFQYATLDTEEISLSTGTSIAGAIGYSLLRNLSLTIDYRAGLIKLSAPDRE